MTQRIALTRGARRLRDTLERFDFTGKGCYPTRDELAAFLGYEPQYVSALVRELREKGYITVQKRRRPGCQYAHNVYRVLDWNPHVRRGICNLRREYQRSKREPKSASSYLERTAGSSRAQTTPVSSPSMRETRCQHVARERARRQIVRIDSRRSMNPPETRLTLVEGGEVAHLKSEIDRLERTNRELIKQQTILGGEFAGLQHTIRKLSSENVALKGEQTRRQREAKNVEQETRVLEAWRTLTGHPRASILPEGRRAEVVREARELGHTDPPLPCRVHAFGPTPKDAVCSVWDELIEAVEGLALLPWAGPRGRCPAGTPGAKPYDGIEYALTSVSKKGRMADESVIERMRGVARQARRADPDVLLASWRHADAHARCCWELLVARLTRDRARWAHETRGTA